MRIGLLGAIMSLSRPQFGHGVEALAGMVRLKAPRRVIPCGLLSLIGLSIWGLSACTQAQEPSYDLIGTRQTTFRACLTQTFPPTWTPTPTATPLPPRPPTLTATPTATHPPRATPAPTRPTILPLLTMPVPAWALEEESRRERVRIVEAAAQAERGNFPAVVLLAIAALESQGTFSNRVADHGVMGITPKAGVCFTQIYGDSEQDLRQNVADGACHLNGYAWERAGGRDRDTLLITDALLQAGYTDYVARVVAAVYWYAGEGRAEYLWVMAEIIDGNVDATRSVPATFGENYRNALLARAFRIGYEALLRGR